MLQRFTSLFLLFSFYASAQHSTVRGLVKDIYSDEPVKNANVTLEKGVFPMKY